ncbi:MAG: DUF1015 family protein [Pseudomonadota bacterium]
MSVDLHPFKAWRPRPELAEKIAAPPYDVLNADEARQMAAGNELSFLHISKPEIDLPPDQDPYHDRIYDQGRQNLKILLERGYTQDPRPLFYVYQQKMGQHVQAGIVAGASAFDYEADRIKKHELTRVDKENDRIRHIETLGAHDEPVFLTYRHDAKIDAIVDGVRAGTPTYDFVSPDGIGHTFWVVGDDAKVLELKALFEGIDCLYVADGHHRSAAGTIISQRWRQRDPKLPRDHEVHFFTAVVFPDDQMQILDYNRVVKDLNGLSSAEFLNKIDEHFEVQKSEQTKPQRQKCFGMFLDGQWYRLTARAGHFDDKDPVKSLDVSILQDLLLGPVLGIQDPRTDKRIDFVGGIRGTAELEKRCGKDMKVAFSMHATTMDQLMAIADAGKMMPPKSTWFEPKLRSGLFIHTFDR